MPTRRRIRRSRFLIGRPRRPGLPEAQRSGRRGHRSVTQAKATEACGLDGSVTPRLSSVLSAPRSTAEISSVPESRIISPTAWIRAADDRPAVTTTTAPRAHPERCSAPVAGSRDTNVSSRSAEEQAVGQRISRSEPRATGHGSGPAGTTSSGSGIAMSRLCVVNAHLLDPGPAAPSSRATGEPGCQVGHDDLKALLRTRDGQRYQAERRDLHVIDRGRRPGWRGRANGPAPRLAGVRRSAGSQCSGRLPARGSGPPAASLVPCRR